MIAAAGEVIDQCTKGLRRTGPADDPDLIGHRDISTGFTHPETGAVIGTVGIIFPGTAISIQFVIRAGDVW